VPDSLGITVGPDRMPQIPGYALQREIGRGGMGVVYLATRNTDKQSVALKTVLPAVSPNQVSLARFLREADIMRQLNHPNIVCCSDAGEVAGLLYFAMEYVEGTNAYLLVRERGQLPIRLATRIAIQLLEGLSFAHTRGFVHRDVKPANVLIAAAPTVSDSVIELVPRPLADTPVVKLTDFGLARTYQASQFSGLTMSGVYGGTPAFMPPEQVTDFRAAKPAADQYSAAATFYYLLTAQTLYDQTEGTPEMLKRVLQSEPINLRQRRPDLPTELALVVHKALARKADQRYSSVDALRTDLLPFAG
jgi:serine/threonine-protein kinase